MLKDIWLPRLIDILPQNILADEKLHAAAEALDFELKALSYDAWQVLHLPRLNELDHDVLDTLAYQFHVDHYEPSTMSKEVKRNLIRQSILWHRIKGTPKSVENFLGAFGIDAETQEWWTYGGEPYFFKLSVSNVAYLGDDGDTFLRLVYAAKNERSWLDAFIFDLLEVQNEIYIGYPEIFANVDTVDSAGVVDSKDEIFISNNAVDAPQDTFDYDFIANQINVDRLSVGNYLWDNDYEIFDAAPVSTDEEADEWEWEWFLEKILLKWKRNPIIRRYVHHFDDEGEIDPDDPEPDEIFPIGDFLRLYWKFPYTKRLRYTTLYNPKENLNANDINSVSLYAMANRVVTNSRGQISNGIARALYVTKTLHKLL